MTICNKQQEEQKISYSRHNPFIAKILERRLLSKPSSSKEVYCVTIDLSNSDLKYEPGDAIGIFPTNPASEVSAILESLGLSGDEEIAAKRLGKQMTLISFLTHCANLAKAPSKLLHYLDTTPTTGYDLRLALLKRKRQKIEVQEFCDCVLPLMPRFYSVASAITPNRVDLLITTFTHMHAQRPQPGLGSHFLCHRAEIGVTPIPLYVQPSKDFKLPHEDRDIIMVGPGVGIAPFRAFMHKRMGANKGRNWLFFGERNASSDFYFKDFWNTLELSNQLKLTTAFSRDREKKHYVQDEMRIHAEELWAWIENGAVVYVCGDAKHMAKAVTEALLDIICRCGNLDESLGKEYMKLMRKEKRFLLDVY